MFKISKILSLSIILAAVFIISGCSKSDSRLKGKWRSNLKLTTEYNEKKARLTDRQKKAFAKMFGKLEINYFTPGKCEIFTPKEITNFETDNTEQEDTRGVLEYKIIYQNDKLAVLVYKDPLKRETVQTYHFVNDNTYWIYLGGSGLADLNMREYFTKIE